MSTKNKNLACQLLPTKNQLITFLVGWLGMQIIGVIFDLAFTVVGMIFVDLPTLSDFTRSYAYNMVLNTGIYVILFFVLLLINNGHIRDILKANSYVASVVAGIICLIAIEVFSIIYNILTSSLQITIEHNSNQAGIEQATRSIPFLSFFTFGILGPICEELTYRVGLFSVCKKKNKYFAYIVSTVVFAMIHFSTVSVENVIAYGFTGNYKAELINELLNIPTYLFAGFALTYTFDKYGFVGSVTGHLANNLLATSLQLLTVSIR